MPEEIVNPKSRKTAFDCFLHICYAELHKAYPEEVIDFSELTKRCSKRWKTFMNPGQRSRFVQIAQEERSRLVSNSLLKIKKTQKRPSGKPKHPLCGYFWFSVHNRKKVREDNPSLSNPDINKELRRLWAAADEETKRTYDAIAEEDKRRYAREMIEYKKKLKQLEESDFEDGQGSEANEVPQCKETGASEVHEISDSD